MPKHCTPRRNPIRLASAEDPNALVLQRKSCPRDPPSPPPTQDEFYDPSESPTRCRKDPYALPMRRWSHTRRRAAKTSPDRILLDWDLTKSGRSALLSKRTIPFTPRRQKRCRTISDATEESLLEVERMLLLVDQQVQASQDFPSNCNGGTFEGNDSDQSDTDCEDFGANDDNGTVRPSSPSFSDRTIDGGDTGFMVNTGDKGEANGASQATSGVPPSSEDDTVSWQDALAQDTICDPVQVETSEAGSGAEQHSSFLAMRSIFIEYGIISPSASPKETCEACEDYVRKMENAKREGRSMTDEEYRLWNELVFLGNRCNVKSCSAEESMKGNLNGLVGFFMAYGTFMAAAQK